MMLLFIYLLTYIDDLLICGPNIDLINEVKCKVSQRFHKKLLGRVRNKLGIEISYEHNHGVMMLNQRRYIETLTEKYGLVNAKSHKTPMEMNFKLEKAEMVDEKIPFRCLIGTLLYIAAGTRHNVAFCVNYLSRFQSRYGEVHFTF